MEVVVVEEEEDMFTKTMVIMKIFHDRLQITTTTSAHDLRDVVIDTPHLQVVHGQELITPWTAVIITEFLFQASDKIQQFLMREPNRHICNSGLLSRRKQ